MFTFIHPTKSGGTALERYFEAHYKEYIVGKTHGNKCSPTNNPIIVLREPIDRFISMYKYWKKGSKDIKPYQRSNEFVSKYGNYTIKDFINLLKDNAKVDLCVSFTGNLHFVPTTHWIAKTPLDKIIIILYIKNLDIKMTHILKNLGVPDKKIPLGIVNESIGSDEDVILNEEDLQYINERFKDDFDLYEKAQTQPELFRMVL